MRIKLISRAAMEAALAWALFRVWPREEAKVLIILLLADRSGIKRSSFLSLVLS